MHATMSWLEAYIFGELLRLPPEHWPNCANLNLYKDGSQSVGWHADDEKLFGGLIHDCTIVSQSLGVTRE